MKKKHWVPILILALTLIFGGVYTFVLFNPPLEISTLGTAVGNKSVVIEIGNKGFREVKLLEVSVNNNEKPSKTKVQVSNAIQGLILCQENGQGKLRFCFKSKRAIACSPHKQFKG
ncbi:hypothetical protein, partial [Lysinibacillus xylanilyticus]|uniref:hypothetical protein n=1 Tax=Lysinibacillus xylanilyticus TaxID=582475 RepID=UPI003D0807DF